MSKPEELKPGQVWGMPYDTQDEPRWQATIIKVDEKWVVYERGNLPMIDLRLKPEQFRNRFTELQAWAPIPKHKGILFPDLEFKERKAFELGQLSMRDEVFCLRMERDKAVQERDTALVALGRDVVSVLATSGEMERYERASAALNISVPELLRSSADSSADAVEADLPHGHTLGDLEDAEVVRKNRRAMLLGDAADPLHPTGKCVCAGDGTCAWCTWRDQSDFDMRNDRRPLRALVLVADQRVHCLYSEGGWLYCELQDNGDFVFGENVPAVDGTYAWSGKEEWDGPGGDAALVIGNVEWRLATKQEVEAFMSGEWVWEAPSWAKPK